MAIYRLLFAVCCLSLVRINFQCLFQDVLIVVYVLGVVASVKFLMKRHLHVLPLVSFSCFKLLNILV